MTSVAVDVLLFRLGAQRFAAELQLISSVLTESDARGMQRLDLRSYIDIDDEMPVASGDLWDEEEDLRLGLLDVYGPPTAVVLGEILGARTLRSADILPVAPWIAATLPPVLRPACAFVDQKVVWLVDLDTLSATS